MDFEVELAVVIGKNCRHCTKESAMSHVAGVTAAHDVSARDWQLKRNGGSGSSKGNGYLLPLGPHLVTLDDTSLADLNNLRVTCKSMAPRCKTPTRTSSSLTFQRYLSTCPSFAARAR